MARYDKNIVLLSHIIKYCDRVKEAQFRFGNTYGDFEKDYDYQSCCSMYVYQIGEYCTHLSDSVKTAYPDIPWKNIRGMRNIFAHDYESVKTERLWDTMVHSLPDFRGECLEILRDLGYEYVSEADDELLSEDDEE